MIVNLIKHRGIQTRCKKTETHSQLLLAFKQLVLSTVANKVLFSPTLLCNLLEIIFSVISTHNRKDPLTPQRKGRHITRTKHEDHLSMQLVGLMSKIK